MSLITANGLAKSFGSLDLFNQITLSVPHRARIGLVGPNGVGKTTLLRILLGLEEPSAGEVLRARSLRTGYLPQESTAELDGTLWSECLTVFADLIARQQELSRLEADLSAMQNPAVLEKYGQLQHEFEVGGGYTYEARIRQVLTGLGFSTADEERPWQQLSGGQRTRALLARLLLAEPDVLCLDEPTNHLDISAIEWLESYLREWSGAIILISHDRYFLNQVVNLVWEMTPALETYRGNYSAYLKQRAERYTRRLEEYQTQQAFVEKEEEYIRRNMGGQNTRQAQGRRKRLERMLVEARLTPPAMESRRLHLKLQPVNRSGDRVLATEQLSIGYADEGRPLFNVPDLVLRRGECAAIVGPNGAGKTTLLKTLLNQIPAYAGSAEMGANLQLGYFAQAHEGLNPEHTLMEEILSHAPQWRPGEVRDYLAKFLFTGDDAFKTISVLSGGERGRLALACLALAGANLLLLDEPTNHLDLPAQEVLQSILADYNGTILLVSHDRYLIDALATQIWEVLPEESLLTVFEGSYSEFKAARQVESTSAVESAPARPIPSAPASTSPRPAVAALSKGELRKRQQRVQALESDIAALELRLSALSSQLESPSNDPARVQQLGVEYVNTQQTLEERMEEWAALAENLSGA